MGSWGQAGGAAIQQVPGGKTGGHKSTGILGDGGLSKFFLNKGLGAVDTGVAGEFGGAPTGVLENGQNQEQINKFEAHYLGLVVYGVPP